MIAIPWRPTPWLRHLAKQVIAAEKIFKCESPFIRRGIDCVECGDHLPPCDNINARWTCSETCRREHRRTLARGKYLRARARSHQKPSEVYVPKYAGEPIVTSKCRRCGEFFVFERGADTRARKRCDACRARGYHIRKERRYVTCAACGEGLTGFRMKFCSKRCCMAYYLPIRRSTPHTSCLNCGNPNPPFPQRRKYCSRECLIAVKDKSPEGREKKRKRTHEIYVKMRGAYLATLQVQKIITSWNDENEHTDT